MDGSLIVIFNRLRVEWKFVYFYEKQILLYHRREATVEVVVHEGVEVVVHEGMEVVVQEGMVEGMDLQDRNVE